MAAGALTGSEWHRYADPATELEVVRLTSPTFASGMPAPHLKVFTRRDDWMLYWSDRAGTRQAFLMDMNAGGSRQLTDAAALDGASLALSADEKSFYSFDGPALNLTTLANGRSRQLYRVPDGIPRTGFTVANDGAAYFTEFAASHARILRVPATAPSRRIAEVPGEIQEVMARPRRAQLLYRSGDALWLVNTDGSGRRQLKTAPGRTGEALWVPSGRTFIYLHIPDDPKELISLREHSPDDNSDRQLARTSQFISASANTDASVFVGASRSKASAYVLILLRATQRELTLCEHHASNPTMVNPVFSPTSHNVVFVSDRDGKPAIYLIPVSRFVEETTADANGNTK